MAIKKTLTLDAMVTALKSSGRKATLLAAHLAATNATRRAYGLKRLSGRRGGSRAGHAFRGNQYVKLGRRGSRKK